MLGVYSSGGSTANLVALGAARQHDEQAGDDASNLGLDGRRLAIYTSSQAHHTIQRSAGVLGIGRASVRSIPVDANRRMDLGAPPRRWTVIDVRGSFPWPSSPLPGPPTPVRSTP